MSDIIGNWSTSISIETDYGADNQGLIPMTGQRIFHLALHFKVSFSVMFLFLFRIILIC